MGCASSFSLQNDVSEKEQRWGAKTVQGSGHQEHINIHKLRENVFQEHQTLKEKELETGPKASHGYGGKFGVEQDRMDRVSGCPGWAAGLHGCMIWVAVTFFLSHSVEWGLLRVRDCSEGSSIGYPLLKLFCVSSSCFTLSEVPASG